MMPITIPRSPGSPLAVWKVHLKVVRVDVEDEDPVVALVVGHRLDHVGREQPFVHLQFGEILNACLLEMCEFVFMVYFVLCIAL